jgi:hypothetical protein
MGTSTSTLTSTQKPCLSECRIKSSQLDPSGFRGETPAYGRSGSLSMPSIERRSEIDHRSDPLIKRLPRKDGELNLGDVEPAAVFGGVVDLELLGEPARFFGLERLVECCRSVRAQIVHDQNDPLGGGIDLVGESTEEEREVDEGALLGRFGHNAAHERLDGEKDIRRAAPPILVVDSKGNSGLRPQGYTNMVEQRLARFIEADLGKTGILRPVIDLEHVLHGVHERPAFFRRNAEAFLLPGLDLVFFSTACKSW